MSWCVRLYSEDQKWVQHEPIARRFTLRMQRGVWHRTLIELWEVETVKALEVTEDIDWVC